MSIKGDPQGGTLADEYDELDVQTIESNFTLTNPNGGTADPDYHPEIHQFKPMGGLARNQRAELVAMDYSTDLRQYGGSQTNTAGTVVWWYELHRNGSFVAQSEKDINKSITSGIQAGGTFGTNFRTENNEGTLVKDHQTYNDQYLNATDGAGGGPGNNSRGHTFYMFRGWFGEGPIFFPDDDLNESVEVMARNVDQSALQFGFDRDLILYWDVFEVEEDPGTRRRR